MTSRTVEKSQTILTKVLCIFKYLWSVLVLAFVKLDRHLDGNLSFFFRHWGKSKFMISMSKRVQMHGVENVFLKSRKAFFYFFMFYLIRDTILYIIIPIYFAKSTGN